MRVPTSLMAVLITVQTVPLAAQESSALAPGAHLRVQVADASRISGRLISLDQAALTLRISSDTTVIPAGRIAAIEVGKRRSRAGRGARIGALVGTFLGLIVGAAATAEDTGYMDIGAAAIPLGMIGGALAGGGVGAVIGAVAGGEEWETVTLEARR